MRRYKRIIPILMIIIAAVASTVHVASADDLYPYTSADEEYMRKQAAQYYVADDPLEEFIDSESGEVAWGKLSPQMKLELANRGTLPQKNNNKIATDNAVNQRQQEARHNIRSYSAAAAVDWGIPHVEIPAVMIPGTEGTMWGPPKAAAGQKVTYTVLSQGTEIRIAMLTDRVDLPEGILGQLTRPVYDSRGKEIFPQAAQIFGRYNYYDQAIIWQHVVVDGQIIKLENPEELRTAISLTERTEPGYILSVRLDNTVLIKTPIL